MGMDSYLELFTTLLGWSFANIIFSVLSSTGLIVLPFLFMFIAAWLEAHERGTDAQAVTWLIRKLEVTVWTAIFVFITCVSPMSITSLTRSAVYYTPVATAVEPTPETVYGDGTGTSFHSALNDTPNSASVPPWWYTVMAISSGINAGVRAGVGGSISDLRFLQQLAQSATIQDPKLREEVQGFNTECFVPARSRYYHQMAGSTSVIDDAIATYGPADVDWMGSRAFRAEPTLYPAMFSRRYLPQFEYHPDIDRDIGPGEDPPVGSRRSCAEWWAAPVVGVRAKLVEQVGSWQGFGTKLGAVVSFASEEDKLDELAKIGLRSGQPKYFDKDAIIGNERDTATSIGQFFTHSMGNLGMAKEAFVVSASMGVFVNLMLMVQPLILMGLYMFLPLVTVLSGYNLQVFVAGALAIFTVKFWTAMWFIARWVDDKLIKAMYPDTSFLMEGVFSPGQSDKRIYLNVIMAGLYIALPLIWTSMMAWAGFSMARGISAMIDTAKERSDRAGSKGADVALTFGRGLFARGRK